MVNFWFLFGSHMHPKMVHFGVQMGSIWSPSLTSVHKKEAWGQRAQFWVPFWAQNGPPKRTILVSKQSTFFQLWFSRVLKPFWGRFGVHRNVKSEHFAWDIHQKSWKSPYLPRTPLEDASRLQKGSKKGTDSGFYCSRRAFRKGFCGNQYLKTCHTDFFDILHDSRVDIEVDSSPTRRRVGGCQCM